MINDLLLYIKIEDLFINITDLKTAEGGELLESMRLIDREKLELLINTVRRSLDYEGRGQISIKKGIFQDLDKLKEKYEGMEQWMGEKLLELRNDIEKLPRFMGKVRMMMIPSVGYFTVVSKCERSYIEFLN